MVRNNYKAYKISKRNQKAIEEYIEKRKSKKLTDITIRNNRSYLNSFFGRVKKDWDKITIQDIYKVTGEMSDGLCEQVKMSLRKFLIFKRRKSIANKIELNSKNLGTITKGREAVLSREEIQKLINAPDELQHQALLQIFIVTGAELKAIQALNIEDIEIKPDAIWIDIKHGKASSEKRKHRRIPIIPNDDNPVAFYPTFLEDWVNYRLKKGAEPTDALFVSRKFGFNERGKRISHSGIEDRIESYRKLAKISKKVSPHVLRHTSASYDGERFNEAMLCQKYGWVIGSNMARRYCHFNEESLANQMREHAGITKEEAKKGKTCPRCGEINNYSTEICVKCHQILDPKKLMEQVMAQEKEKKKIEERFKQMEKQFKVSKNENKELKKDMEKQIKNLQRQYDRTVRVVQNQIMPEFHNMQDRMHYIENQVDEQGEKAKITEQQNRGWIKKFPTRESQKKEIERLQELEKNYDKRWKKTKI